MTIIQRVLYLCACLACLALAKPVGAQEMLEGDPEQAARIGTLTYRDSSGALLRTRSFIYEADSLSGDAIVREIVSDTAGTTAVYVNRYEGAHLAEKEEFDSEGRLLKRTSYQFAIFDGTAYPSLEEVEVFQPVPHVYHRSFRYSDTDGHHYPLEITSWKSGGKVDRMTYTYPFSADPAFRPTADSLLARNMPGAILSMTHWRDSVRIDSTIVLYGKFPGPDTSYLRPSAIVLINNNEKADTCIRFLSYDSLGRQASQVYDRRERKLHSLDPRQLQWTAPDPATERLRTLRAYDYCAADPCLRVDKEEGDDFLFDDTGSYLCRVQSPSVSKQLFLWQGYGTRALSARFADPVHDPSTIGLNTQVRIVSSDEIQASLEKTGVFSSDCHGFFKALRFMYVNSGYGGVLDFAVNGQHDIVKDVFYITQTTVEGNVAHNNYNYGNFLWGATADELGIPLFLARLGAHINNFFLSPDTKGGFDTKDDQFSIRAGYHWH